MIFLTFGLAPFLTLSVRTEHSDEAAEPRVLTFPKLTPY